MSYKTYTTEALVCGSSANNTSDKSFLLFTREAGMLFASARSVREERSKQRYALQDFSQIRVSLVKGKSGWRVGSVEPLGNSFLSAQDRKARARVSFVFTALRRFVHGELALERAYADSVQLLSCVHVEDAAWEKLQQLFLLRLLAQLGYVASTPAWEVLIGAPTLFEAAEAYDGSTATELRKAIEHGSEVSHL